MKIVNFALALSSVLLIQNVNASCNKSVIPSIPETSISTIEMAAVKADVQTYMAETKQYLNCVKRKKLRNSTIDEMRAVAANYNVLIQIYREDQQYLAEQSENQEVTIANASN